MRGMNPYYYREARPESGWAEPRVYCDLTSWIIVVNMEKHKAFHEKHAEDAGVISAPATALADFQVPRA